MKIEKKKIVFGSILLGVIIFIVAYSIYVFGNDPTAPIELKRPVVPKLKEEKKEYKSRTEAVDNLKENRPRILPGLYDKNKIEPQEDNGPEFQQKEKERLMDSVLNSGESYREHVGNQKRSMDSLRPPRGYPNPVPDNIPEEVDLLAEKSRHQEFFLYNPDLFKSSPSEGENQEIMAEVSGDQVVKNKDRLELKLLEDLTLGRKNFPRNTRFYATVNLQPNRLVLKIDGIDEERTPLEVFDVQDGKAGIYIENSLVGGVTTKVIDDIVEGIDVPGVPQVKGISTIFKKDNNKIKVTVLDHYKLILKLKS